MADPNKPADANRDPLTGAPGAHPVGVGTGAAGGGAAGAAVGAVVGGPVGAAVGGAVGAVAGGLAGKGAAEAVNPTVEDEYWRRNYGSRPYASSGTYDDFRPAYQYGWESFSRYRGLKFDDVEPDLRRGWETGKLGARLGWDKARPAARDAWDRVERAVPGELDKHGR
ncbi:MAG: hypothetical protein DMF77_22140 [Acidobacteria bacterium]|nr:MAG: hypothetical protein DMF77_22140 [Acidobacteriota bacterium]